MSDNYLPCASPHDASQGTATETSRPRCRAPVVLPALARTATVAARPASAVAQVGPAPPRPAPGALVGQPASATTALAGAPRAGVAAWSTSLAPRPMRSHTAHPLARGCFWSRAKPPAAAAWMPKRALSRQSNVTDALPVSTQVRVRRLLPQVAVHDAVLGRPRHGRRRPRDGRHHRHDLCQDEVKLKPEGAVSGHRRRAVA